MIGSMQKPRAMRDVFIERLSQEMASNDKIFFLTADFGAPALDAIRKNFPDRFVNVGIAEQNLINIATGLALEGYTVYAYAIAAFITMRCYEQIRVNLSILSQLKRLNVNLVGVGSGLSYDVSGPSHHCLEDLSIMRLLPNFEVFSPSDYVQAGNSVGYTLKHAFPKYLRFDSKPLPPIYTSQEAFSERGFAQLSDGDGVCIISTGYMTHKALRVIKALEEEKIHVGLIDFYLLNGFDKELMAETIRRYKYIATIEEGFIHRGGMDSIISDMIVDNSLNVRLIRFGIRGNYNFNIGNREHLHTLNGSGEAEIYKEVKNLYG